ncbi:hypothetical protein B296_00035958 [Ensete ventricosum]|uniref:Lactate/malate dehydrogenase C-terminal domain-containing protein n=1 Tax=Ensete ventricosum TaxID=4639 RepID=A0A426ZRW7_ENSVE|nr:hypothetical protein B296_00035958 [Ensete ventricosum]
MLGSDQPVILHLLDIPPAAEALNGVKMELIDAAFPLLKGMQYPSSEVNLQVKQCLMTKFVLVQPAGVVATTDVAEACCGVNIAIMVGGFRRKEGMERKDVLSKNVSIYKAQASALEQYAAANCKVLQLSDEFITFVQQQGAAIIKARKLSSALSAASAACDHIHDWVLGTPKVCFCVITPDSASPMKCVDATATLRQGTWTSMGVYSDGSYGVLPGLIYSFPVTCNKGEWSIVQGKVIHELI